VTDTIIARVAIQGANCRERVEEVTAREAAQMLDVNLQFLYQLIWSGKLAGRKVERTWRIPKSVVEARRKERRA
jgi:excisionase family DNA binding protein